MDAILLRWEVRHLRFQFQHFQNVGDLPGDVVHGTEVQLVVNLPTQGEICLLYTSGIGNHGVAESAGFQRSKRIFLAPHPIDFIEILGADGRIRFTPDVSLGIHEIKDIDERL